MGLNYFNCNAAELMIRVNNVVKRGYGLKIGTNNPYNTEVYRSLWFTNPRYLLFVIDIDFHNYEPFMALENALSVAREIDKKYPLQWAYSGRGIHGHILLDEKKTPDFKYLRSKYNDVEIMRAMAQNMSKNMGSVDLGIYHSRAMIRSLGSINLKTNTFKIPIDILDTPKNIYEQSKEPFKDLWKFKIWREELPIKGITKFVPRKMPKIQKINMEFKDFPPCIKLILQNNTISFIERSLIIPFLRDIGWDVEKIYDFFLSQYGVEKYKHIKEGREVERYFQANYRTPSCKWVKQMGLCPNNCGKKHPLQAE